MRLLNDHQDPRMWCIFAAYDKTKRQAGDAQDPNDAQRANNTNASI